MDNAHQTRNQLEQRPPNRRTTTTTRMSTRTYPIAIAVLGLLTISSAAAFLIGPPVISISLNQNFDGNFLLQRSRPDVGNDGLTKVPLLHVQPEVRANQNEPLPYAPHYFQVHPESHMFIPRYLEQVAGPNKHRPQQETQEQTASTDAWDSLLAMMNAQKNTPHPSSQSPATPSQLRSEPADLHTSSTKPTPTMAEDLYTIFDVVDEDSNSSAQLPDIEACVADGFCQLSPDGTVELNGRLYACSPSGDTVLGKQLRTENCAVWYEVTA